MFVVPLTIRARCGKHHGNEAFGDLIHSIIFVVFLSLLAASYSMVAEASDDAPASFRCRLRPDAEIKKKYLYINDTEKPVTLMTSRRVPHRLLTHVVKLFLRDYLGYVNVVLTYNDAAYPTHVLHALGYNDAHDIYNLPEDYTPKALINLELWFPPVDNDHTLEPLGTNSYLGVVGRIGWFFPNFIIRINDELIDHWRIFVNKNSKALDIFSRTQEELISLHSKTMDPISKNYYCDDKRCENGIFTPELCKIEGQKCAVLFASYYDMSNFVIDQIISKSLFVQVVWLGSNLNHEFVETNFNLKNNRSVLFFHYTPDTLLRPFDLASVAFPSCTDRAETFCQYEMHRLQKFVWNGLKSADTFLFNSLERISLDKGNYSALIDQYNSSPGKSEQEVACDWMKNNPDIWKFWSMGDGKPSLYVVGLFPISSSANDRKFLAPGCVPSFEMAINAINSNNSVLPHFNLTPMIANTGCEPDLVLLEFIKIIKHSTKEKIYNKLVGIVGPACSDTVEPIAGVSKYFKMSIISYGAEGAIFSDREKYPYFFRTIPENKIFRHVYLQLFKKLKWTRVGSLTEDGHKYSEYMTPLQDLLMDNGIYFHMRKYPQETKPQNMTLYLKELKKNRLKIIIGDFYQDVARAVFCEAIKQQMTGNQGYVWFFPRWFSNDWYVVDNVKDSNADRTSVSCTTQQMLHGLQGHMSLSYKYYGDDDSLMPENISVKEWRRNYKIEVEKKNKMDNFSPPIEESDYAGFTYDAVWTYALALDKLFKEDLSYTSNLRSPKTINRFIHYINNTDFNGVSGHINFTHGPSRLTDIVIYQFTNKSYNEVGRFYPNPTDEYSKGRLDLQMEELNWPLGVLPKDGSHECIVEAFRRFFGEGTSCNSALIILCTICFGSLGMLLIFVVVFFKHSRYEIKLRMIEEMWRDQSIYKKLEGWEIPKSKVVINRKLGEGQFGTVYGGECFIDEIGWQAVAVKTLTGGSTASDKLDFLSEAEMMKNVEHENVVKLIGVCTESEPVYTVMEFMLYGDLKTFLLARRNLVNEKNRNDDDEVSNRRLTSMALDVAEALAYLSELKYVHRDIACRNCLVNAHRSVKLADFGMSRSLNEKDYYRFSRKGMMPVRWMAPESLVDGVFTTQSDIWSYGVLIYEIITFGAFPFQGLNNSQVYERVKSGQTLPIPVGINSDLELLLQSCWQPNPTKRILASKVVIHLQNCPRLISPSLDGPESSVTMENPAEVDLHILPDKSRKLALNNSRTGGVGGHPGGGGLIMGGFGGLPLTTNNRKRSMSGNMVLPPILSCDEGGGADDDDDDVAHRPSSLDALNLNLMEELRGGGQDPLLPLAPQYISATRFLSIGNHIERERELLVKRQVPHTPILPSNITPV